MKQLLYLLFTLPFFPPTLSSQNEAIQHFIQQHKSDRGFTYAFLSKDLFEVAIQSDINAEEWRGIHQAVQNIGSLSILAADSLKDALPLYREVKSMIPDDSFEELLTVRDGNENVRIWVKSAENMVTDLVLLVGSPHEFVLVCFAGNLELGNLADLAKLFEAGKAESLARTSTAVAIDFAINPNPSNGQFTVTYSDEQDPPAQLSVIDLNGRAVANLNLSGAATQSLAFQHLPDGLYWVQLKTRNGKVGMKQVQILK